MLCGQTPLGLNHPLASTSELNSAPESWAKFLPSRPSAFSASASASGKKARREQAGTVSAQAASSSGYRSGQRITQAIPELFPKGRSRVFPKLRSLDALLIKSG